MSDTLEIFEQARVTVGQYEGKDIAVYPPSPARFLKITKAIRESKATMFKIVDEVEELISQVKLEPANDKLKADLEVKREEYAAAILGQIDAIAPILVMMTAVPEGSPNYKWNPVFKDQDFAEGMPIAFCLKVVDAYTECAQIAEILKKITALSR